MENYKRLFTGYLQNQLSGDELRDFTEWLKTPENKEQFDLWMEDDWNSFTSQSNPNISTYLSESQIPIQTKPKSGLNWAYRIAATIVLPIAIGAATYFVLSKSKPSETLVYNEINVPLGSKTKIVLSDGSSIWLNSGSKLRYPQQFNSKLREVELTGEGFFEITKNPKQPFIVRASEIQIKVLGTSFNVKSYPDERLIETTLIKGSITLSKNNGQTSNNQNLLLKPNQKATYIKDKGKLFLSESETRSILNNTNSQITTKESNKVFLSNISDTEQYIAWKDDKLIFKNENFESLCNKLERWFNVKINIKSESLKNYHYTGTIKNETINDVIDILHLTMSFKYDINHSVINIWTTSK